MKNVIEKKGEHCNVLSSDGVLLVSFTPTFQPIFTQDNQALFGFECLPEMQFNSGEDYRASNFFLHNDIDCIRSLVIQQVKFAIQFIQITQCRVSVNLDMSDLNDAEFFKQILSLSVPNLVFELDGYDLDKAQFTQLVNHVRQLKQAGVEFWLDNYDARQSTHNQYVKLREWDGVKLAPDFSAYLIQNPKKWSVFEKLPTYVPTVIVDGVKDEPQHEFALLNGACAQGIYYSYPLYMQAAYQYVGCKASA
ncbi:MAG: EAL domain-containing protein [Vibrio sp.]